jgi:hypothetical protein
MTPPLLKCTLIRVLLFIVSTSVIAFVVFGFIHQIRQTHARAVDREWHSALDASKKLPLGIERADDFLARLKRIDLNYAPDEFKRAIADFIAALEADINALKAGQDIAPYDKALAQAQGNLVVVSSKYD